MLTNDILYHIYYQEHVIQTQSLLNYFIICFGVLYKTRYYQFNYYWYYRPSIVVSHALNYFM